MANLIKKIHIRNFRSIVDETIDCADCNIFVGKNDAGKSNVLKALNLFFNPQQSQFSFENDFSIYHKTGLRHAEEIVIELTIEIPSSFTDKGELRWKRVWRFDGYRSDLEKFSKTFKPRSRTKMFLNNIHFEYIPAVKSSDYYKYLLRKVYSALLKSESAKIDSANGTYSETISTLTNEITKEVENSIHIASYIKMPDNIEQLFGDLAIKTQEGTLEVPLHNRGDGIQARHIPAILQFVAKQERNAEENNITKTFIWGVEEPENGVEMGACFELATQLNNYSSDIQMFITTHSPAFYGISSGLCYFAKKRADGSTQYIVNSKKTSLDDELGIMPLIAPYIEDKIRELECQRLEQATLINDIKKLRDQTERIIIFTEGKSDEIILSAAFKQLETLENVIFNPNVEKYGSGELDKLYSELRKSQDTNIKICIYDRDEISKIFASPFESTSNQVYRFNIPVPSCRSITDKISIEHYFTDEQIKTIDENGRRLYMANEFDSRGTLINGTGFSPFPIKRDKEYTRYPLHILDGGDETTVVYLGTQNKNMALNKMTFANYVKDRHSGFDFDMTVFQPIIDLINHIITDSKS